MQDNCLFCLEREVHWGQNIYETENFKLRIGIGIIAPGHCMIVTKKHYPCMAAIPDSLDAEYLELKERVRKSIIKHFNAEPYINEYGVYGQSVPHAHTHFIPTESKEYKKIDFIKERIIPAIKKHNIPYKITDFKGLKEIYKEDGQYESCELDGKMYVLRVKTINQTEELKVDIGYREFFTNLGLKGVHNWRKMTEEEIALDKIKGEKTKILAKF